MNIERPLRAIEVDIDHLGSGHRFLFCSRNCDECLLRFRCLTIPVNTVFYFYWGAEQHSLDNIKRHLQDIFGIKINSAKNFSEEYKKQLDEYGLPFYRMREYLNEPYTASQKYLKQLFRPLDTVMATEAIERRFQRRKK
jgi:hypothetical protein